MRARAGVLVALLLSVASPADAEDSPAGAEERFALIVTGAPGGDSFVKTYGEWTEQLMSTFIGHLGFPADQVVVLSGTADAADQQSTQQNVRTAIESLARQAQKDDLVVVVLVGHGTVDDGSAKFNLVGPDMTSAQWAGLLRDLPGRLVAINTTGGSFPFLKDLAGRGRIVITATESTVQRYDTVFPEQLIAALKDPASDLDKNGRVSVWELFARTSAAVATHFERQGLLATERALLDDTGDGAGVEAPGASRGLPDRGAPPGGTAEPSPAADGALARATYLEREMPPGDVDPETAELLTRRRALEEQAERLKQRKPAMPIEQWEREFEALMIELARVSRRLRSRS